MCMSDAAQIIEVSHDGAEAIARIRGAPRSISLALLTLEGTPVGAGDWVLTNLGLAIGQLDESEAAELLAMTERDLNGEAR